MKFLKHELDRLESLRDNIFLNFAVSVAAIIPIYMVWLYKVIIHPRPFYVHYYDPETIYFYGGMEILKNNPLVNVDNPGLPVYLMSALIQKVLGSNPLNLDNFRLVAYISILIIYFLAIFVISRYVLSGLPFSLQLSCLWLYFIAPQSLEYFNVFSPEMLMLPIGALVLLAIYGGDLNDFSYRRIFFAGLAIGLCISLKFTCFSFALALILSIALLPTMPFKRRFLMILVALLSVIGSFLLITVAFVSSYREMFSRLWKFSSHTGMYGSGPIGFPSISIFCDNLLSFFLSAKAWSVLVIFCFIFATSVFFRISNQRSIIQQRARFIWIFSIVSSFYSYIFAARVESSALRYILPTSIAVVGLFSSALKAYEKRIPNVINAFIFLLVFSLLVKHSIQDMTSHDERIRLGLILKSEISSQLKEIDAEIEKRTVIYSWRVPIPSFALRAMAGQDQLKEVEKKYPLEGHWTDWSNGISLPCRSFDWDYAVVWERELEKFPTSSVRKVGKVQDYIVIANGHSLSSKLQITKRS